VRTGLVGLGLVVTALVGLSGAEVPKDPFDAMVVHRPVEVAPAPDVAFHRLDGREARVRDLRGKVVLLGFFTTS
jgi:hypothetical protein